MCSCSVTRDLGQDPLWAGFSGDLVPEHVLQILQRRFLVLANRLEKLWCLHCSGDDTVGSSPKKTVWPSEKCTISSLVWQSETEATPGPALEHFVMFSTWMVLPLKCRWYYISHISTVSVTEIKNKQTNKPKPLKKVYLEGRSKSCLPCVSLTGEIKAMQLNYYQTSISSDGLFTLLFDFT